MNRHALHRRARERGANPIVYWIVRAFVQPALLLYFRLERIGLEHVPRRGPVIFACNHRSFLDPFVVGTLLRRPMYYVAKKELFQRRWQAWILNALGAFPVDRGNGDQDSMDTAKAILARGGAVLIFPEGTRVRPGPLGRPRRGLGRLALETGAPVVPVALIGTEDVRRGWRIRPHKIRARCGRPLTFPHVEKASPQLAAAVTDRIWPCVQLQWEWLGGIAPLRHATVIGAGAWGTSLAILLARAGLSVDLGCRTREQAEAIRSTRRNDRYLPGVELPPEVVVARAAELDLADRDLVCLAVPSRALPTVVAAHADRLSSHAGMLVLSKGVVPPLGTLPSAYVSERVPARAVAAVGGPGHAAESLDGGAALVVASTSPPFASQLSDVLTRARIDVQVTRDVTGVELAGCAKNAAVLAAAAAAPAGANAAGAAAGKVFAEVDAYARSRGGRRETFAGLAGAGDLVATVVADGSRNRRAGELLARGVPGPDIAPALGQAVESVDSVPLLADMLREADVPAPTISGLAALIEGRIDPERWAEMITAPQRPRRGARAA